MGDVKANVLKSNKKALLLWANKTSYAQEKKNLLEATSNYKKYKEELNFLKLYKKLNDNNEKIKELRSELYKSGLIYFSNLKAYQEQQQIIKDNALIKKEISKLEVEYLSQPCNKILLDKFQIKEINNVDISEFKPVKISHGFTGFIFKNSENRDVIGYTFHTSKNETLFFNKILKNVSVEEDLNPILYVNPMQFMMLDDFKTYFKIKTPTLMFENIRYGNNKSEDMAYCSLRAGFKSLTQSSFSIMMIRENPNMLTNFVVNNIFNITDRGVVLTPAQVSINDFNSSDELIEISSFTNKLKAIIEEIDQSQEKKVELQSLIESNYYEIIGNN